MIIKSIVVTAVVVVVVIVVIVVVVVVASRTRGSNTSGGGGRERAVRARSGRARSVLWLQHSGNEWCIARGATPCQPAD